MASVAITLPLTTPANGPGPVSAPVAVIAPAIVAISLATAMLLGGSGSMVPLPEIVLQCLLAGLTAAWVWVDPDGLRKVPPGAWIIAALMLALPLLQLLPLPPVLWQNLPGRSLEKAALDLVGQGANWQPLSLTANRTLASLLAMAAPAAVLVMTAAQNRRGRAVLLATMAGMAALSVLVGAAQLSGGAGNVFRFYIPDEAFLNGFQTNHNAEADVLLIGMVALAAAAADFALPRRRPAIDTRRQPAIALRLVLGMVGAATLLLILGVVLTASRTGIALLPIAIGAQVLILRRWLRLNRRHMAAAAIIALTMLGVAAAASGAAWCARPGVGAVSHGNRISSGNLARCSVRHAPVLAVGVRHGQFHSGFCGGGATGGGHGPFRQPRA